MALLYAAMMLASDAVMCGDDGGRQEMPVQSPGGNYLGVRKSNVAKRRFKKAAHSIMAAGRMAKLMSGGKFAAGGVSVAAMAKRAAAAEAKRAEEGADGEAEVKPTSPAVRPNVDDGNGLDAIEGQCAQCGNVALGSEDDQTGDFYCTCRLRLARSTALTQCACWARQLVLGRVRGR